MPSFLPRSLATLAALGVLSVASSSHAQTPAPAAPSYAPAAPGYAPAYAPPGAYAPMMQQAPAYLPPGWAPPAPLEPRSPSMVTGGAVLIALGSAAGIAGAAMLAVGTTGHYDYSSCPTDIDCFPTYKTHPAFTAGGAVLTAISLASLSIGIPMLAYGRTKVVPKPAVSLVPTVRVGAGASLTWQLQ